MGTTHGYRELWGKALFVLLLTMAAWSASATIWYVAPDGTGGGASWQEAGPLQATVTAASSGDEVWVAAGTYTAATDPVLTMKVGVALYGGFSGTESERGQRDWKANVTTLDGQNARRCVNGANNTVLDGFVITRGQGDFGGGMYNDEASPTVLNCAFTENTANVLGGGMYNDKASPTVKNCTFIGNEAAWGSGGGIKNSYASPTVMGCTFIGNKAPWGTGGGMSNEKAAASVINCIFMGNTANRGGGMENWSSPSPIITNCTFTENSAFYGGGMRNWSYASVILTNCILWNNRAGSNSEIEGETTVRYSCIQGGFSGIGNIDVDPLLLTSPGIPKLYLNSPCIDAGTSDGAPDTDLAGNSRPQGLGVDMGAYEGGVAEEDTVVLTITTTPAGTGVTRPTEGVYSYQRGDTALISAQNMGGLFVRWSGDISGDTAEIRFVMDADRTATAEFDENIYYVNANSSASNPDGRSWETAYATLQEAVDRAEQDGGGSVWAAAGRYTAATERVLKMKQGVSILGGFLGTETLPDQRDWENNLTVIDGESTRRCVQGADLSRLDGFHVVNGRGSGMFNYGASPEVLNCTFSGNSTDLHGGGMYNGTAAPVVTNCTFADNTANGSGGGMYNGDALPVVTDCIFSGNTAKTSGGGMYNGAAIPEVTNCTFSDNTTNGNGGGMYNYYATEIKVTNCSFSNNSAAQSGGGLTCLGNAIVDRCTFSGNQATLMGGAAHTGEGTQTFVNCIAYGNAVTDNSLTSGGGGMYADKSTLSLTNCTFADNKAPVYGGAIRSNACVPSILNSVFADNTALQHPDISGGISLRYSCIQGGFEGVGNISLHPRLVRPGCQLHPDSPCLDSGTAEGAPDVDRYGHPRPAGDGVDMGACEGYLSRDAIATLSLDVTPPGTGITVPAPGVLDVELGTVLSLSARGVGHVFHSWTGDVSESSSTVSLVMDGDKNVTAQFVVNRYFVNPNLAPHDSDGRSWDSAHILLQDAVDSAYDDGGGEVWVVGGRYTALANAVLNMRTGVYLYGGFSGTETERDQRNWQAHPTILDGEATRCCVTGADYAVLDGFRIQNGKGVKGGGMANISVSPTISNCTFVSNSAETGGGIYNRLNTVTILDTSFVNNFAYEGGGIYNQATETAIHGCTFNANTAGDDVSHIGSGAGIYNSLTTMNLSESRFLNNTVKGLFLCYYVGDKTPSDRNAEDEYDDKCGPFDPDCYCSGYNGNAAGIRNYNSAASITNCLFQGNECKTPAPTAQGYSYNGWGAAAYNSGSSTSFVNCTLIQNMTYNGPIVDEDASANTTQLLNCIVWDNLSPIDIQGTVTYSCIEGGYEGAGNISGEPLFISEYRLQSGSPCRDTATSDGAPDTDIEGIPRPQGTGWDMGAFEYAPPVITLAGKAELALACDAPYVEAGLASVLDVLDGEVVDLVDPASVPVLIWQQAVLVYTSSLLHIEDDFNNPEVIARPVEPAQERYTLTYEVTGPSGGPTTATRLVRLECPLSDEGEAAEGEILPEGEGEVPAEGEGETPAEGEVLPEGETPTEGEGEIPAEGEGEVLPEGEGEAPIEGEATEGESEGEPEDDACGCCASTDKYATPEELFKRILGDWLIIGISLLVLMSTSLRGGRNM